MKYIQSVELREWVKESLRKTIFQKAHALSIQTGCDILVKLHDDSDDSGLQYYATGSLHTAYKDNVLCKHPKEKLVSGETGLPIAEYVDQAIQSGSTDDQHHLVDTISTQEIFSPDQIQFDKKDQENILPLHLTVSNESACVEEAESRDTSEQETPSDNTQPTEGVQIKVETEDIETQSAMLSENLDPSTQRTGSEGFSDFQSDLPMDTAGSDQTDSLQEEAPFVGTFSMPISPKPYQCAVCGKAFRSVQVLQKHTQTFHFRGQGSHRGQGLLGLSRGRGRGYTSKRYQCVLCSRSFPHPDLLQDHMSRSHMSQEPSQELTSQQPSQSAAMFPSNTSGESSSSTLESQPQGPFHITDAPDESQPSTSGVMLPQSWAVPNSSNPFSPQKRRLGGSPYRFPRIGRPAGGGQSSPVKSQLQGTTPKTDGEFRKSFWQRGSTSFEIMRSLLRCSGPISTFTAFTQSGPPRLRSISKQAYNGAAEELQKANLGTLVSLDREGAISTPGRSPIVFIKSPPEIARPILCAGLIDMCSPDEYANKFNSKVPAKISRATRQKLVILGYVTAEQMLVSNTTMPPPVDSSPDL